MKKKNKKYRIVFRDKRDSLRHIKYFSSKARAKKEYNLMKRRKYEIPKYIESKKDFEFHKNFRSVW